MKNVLFLLLASALLHSCIEPFQIEQTDFKSYLVIEATITDEDKPQQVLISRTYPLDTVQSNPESNAVVQLSDSNGGAYTFTEAENGRYVSTDSFAAVAGQEYTLSVKTADGNNYVSDTAVMPPPTEITRVYASRELKDGLEDGIFIYVDSYDPSGNSKYYRYEYEETYKIIAPFFSAFELYIVTEDPNPVAGVRGRQEQELTCFTTELSNNEVVQTKTTALDEDMVTRFPVRFINRENYIISHRYSILVKQYVQSREAYEYYETLAALSGSESLFTQIQTGFLEGNIRSEGSNEENVLGYFQLSSVSQKRLFFNYTDFFPGERLPDYQLECTITSPQLADLVVQIELGLQKFWGGTDEDNPEIIQYTGPYLMVQAGCGDCTVLGSNVKPDFWQEQ